MSEYIDCNKADAEEMSIFIGKEGTHDGSGWSAWIPVAELIDGVKAKYRKEQDSTRKGDN